ncbi:MAG TPA: pentapeptide repeat-containing protein, partial [Ktedonobacteraceae bacterium]|nr:pentapeptide repeat-containing protein [Ktedonobacteraceae bacterium]
MVNQELVDLLKQGVAQWNEWRPKCSTIYPDLYEADLHEADLSGADLHKANLRRARLSGADLSGADLSEAILSKANLNGARLSGAKLSGADLREADLTATNLGKANLRGADLREANLRGASLHEADLWLANLSGANLSWAELNGANLSWVDLHGFALSKVQLMGANLRRANLHEADLSWAYLSEADLYGATLSRATLINTNLTGAILTGCAIYGISVWDAQLKGAQQDNLIITDDRLITGYARPVITVDDLEVAQFIYLLLNHKKLRNVLNAVTERGVLLLGGFGGGGLDVLQAVAARLREENYLPIIFDFDRPADRNYTETVKTLVGLSRFIIADLSGPSVPQELYATVPHFKIPFVPILEAGRRQFAMAVDLLE